MLNELDEYRKVYFQELINIISYIAIIEEFNYPKILRTLVLQGRADCFGRYVEVLFGNERELKRLLESNSFKNGAKFIHKKEIDRWYFYK